MVKVISPPITEPVNPDDFQIWMQGLPLNATQEAMVKSLLISGREEAESYQNVAYCEQTLQLTVEPDCKSRRLEVKIPRPPFRELKSVMAICTDGTLEDITSQFDVHNDGGPAVLSLKYDGTIPDFSRLQVTYTAGYDVDKVPEKVKQAILLYATWSWMHRSGDSTIPAAFYALLSKGRVVPV